MLNYFKDDDDYIPQEYPKPYVWIDPVEPQKKNLPNKPIISIIKIPKPIIIIDGILPKHQESYFEIVKTDILSYYHKEY